MQCRNKYFALRINLQKLLQTLCNFYKYDEAKWL